MELADVSARAAGALRSARSLVITAGAGMGVDSGLPDFRGDQGFWKAYPPYERLGLTFVEAANPEHFDRDPAFGWGFYGHRLHLYRDTAPHPGFGLLLGWIERLGLEAFVVTSNVDGQFQKAGFPERSVLEIHGSIHHLQCGGDCYGIWECREEVPVDLETMRARRIPRCIRCHGVARPNILMFGDMGWLPDRTEQQRRRFEAFEQRAEDPLVVVEMGAGTAIPSIRFASENLGRRDGARVVRINPREPQIGAPHLSLPVGALEGLRAIDAALGPR
ncbi:MAG: NAD-dependent deacetylase [Deltaproteobacteria bacterium]|nr:NAD-dependent deacetylase [Deltaproteobacteria bacterium]